MQMRPYAQRLSHLFQNLSAAGQDAQAWYNQQREENKILVVLVSSDRGLCGAFNSTIIKAAIRMASEKYPTQYAKGNVTFLPLGKKAFEFAVSRLTKVVQGEKSGISSSVSWKGGGEFHLLKT